MGAKELTPQIICLVINKYYVLHLQQLPPTVYHLNFKTICDKSLAMASRTPFPQQESDFGSDTRISYSKVDEKFILEDDDGSEWEFDASLGKWMPSVSSTPPT